MTNQPKEKKLTKKQQKMLALGINSNSWIFNASKEDVEYCICKEWDGKGVSVCGFPCPVHSAQPKEKKQDWEKELRKKFCVTKNNHPHCEEAYDFEVIEADPEELEDFISSLLEQTRERAIEECIGIVEIERNKEITTIKNHPISKEVDTSSQSSVNRLAEKTNSSLQLLKNNKK